MPTGLTDHWSLLKSQISYLGCIFIHLNFKILWSFPLPPYKWTTPAVSWSYMNKHSSLQNPPVLSFPHIKCRCGLGKGGEKGRKNCLQSPQSPVFLSFGQAVGILNYLCLWKSWNSNILQMFCFAGGYLRMGMENSRHKAVARWNKKGGKSWWHLNVFSFCSQHSEE